MFLLYVLLIVSGVSYRWTVIWQASNVPIPIKPNNCEYYESLCDFTAAISCNPLYLPDSASSVQSRFALRLFIASINQHPLTTKTGCHAIEKIPPPHTGSDAASLYVSGYSKGGRGHVW